MPRPHLTLRACGTTAAPRLTNAAALGWAFLMLLPGSLHAQTPARLSSSVQHTVRAGDTLEQLARRYLGEGAQWPRLQAHNQVPDPYRLRPGTVLEIPFHWMRSASASVDYVQGSASVRRSLAERRTIASTAVPLAPHMPLQEGDQITLGPDAFVTVRLADGSTVRVQAQSQLQLQQLRRRGRAGSLQSVLELQQGGLDIQVPGAPEPQRRLQIMTPAATTSVRGTQFHVHLDASGRTSTALYQGQLAVQAWSEGMAGANAMLAPGYGIAVSALGQVSAASALLPAPDTTTLPTLHEDAQWLQLTLPAMEGAAQWHVQLSADAAGQQVLRNGQFAPGLARFAAVPDGAYYMQLRAIDAQGLHGQPAQLALRVKAHPVAPLTQSPAPQAMLAHGEAAWQCTPVDGAQAYRLHVAPVPTGQSLPASSAWEAPLFEAESLTQCQFDLHQLPTGHYAGRVASVRLLGDGMRDTGPFSAPTRFHVAQRPTAPSAEQMQARDLAGVEHIYWPGEPGQRYRLQVLDVPQAAQPTLDTVLTQAQWTASGLPPGTWYVRIQVQDPSGLHSAFSPPRSVQIRPLVRDSAGQPLTTGTGLGVEHPSY